MTVLNGFPTLHLPFTTRHPMFGYHGRYLRIDPRPGRTGLVALDEATLRRFVGGVGLGTWLVAQETAAGCDPLGANAALAFALSPLVGTPLTTSAKFAVVALSPLTGRLCDALSSSHFALAAKRAGVDAIVISGRWDEPVTLFVSGDDDGTTRVSSESAADLWGLPASEAESRLRARHGADWQVAAIGPAGEALIPFATISHDGRHAGRGGLGAVLGAKRVKAVAVRGSLRTPLADPSRTVALARSLSERSFGPATEKYRELGTVANLLVFNRFAALPTRNFASGSFDGAENLAAADLAPARRVARNSCAACTIGCEHVYAREKGQGGVRLEYESLFALGPLCGVDEPAAVLSAAASCDEVGLDTISTGGTIAFAMDCADRGWIDARLPSGRPLRFGDGEAVVEAIGAIARREGIGAWLAEGSRRAAERSGVRLRRWPCTSRGSNSPATTPAPSRPWPSACPSALAGPTTTAPAPTRPTSPPRPTAVVADPVRRPLAIATEDRAALIDSLILCKFLRGVFSDLFVESAEMLTAVTGWDVSAEELRQVARRVVNARKLVNQREGWTCAEDTLPDRLLNDDGLPRSRLDAMIADYYRLREWDAAGRVPPALRDALGLNEPAFGHVPAASTTHDGP